MDKTGTHHPQSTLLDAGLLVIRVMIGIVLIYHGSQKLFGLFGGPGIPGFTQFLEKLQVPAPHIGAVLAACTEFFGGLLILTGLILRVVAVPVIFNMLVGFFTAHKGVFDSQKGGGEYPLTLVIVTLGLLLTGPGRWSVNEWIRRKRE
ncbi:MAG: DoxX family protein [Planctomycetes bacterium]|nr:DoxX family protein [Planctomycetota bacterium]MBI3834616.1 DoxX family protein [Planctomycetota bacterium]